MSLDRERILGIIGNRNRKGREKRLSVFKILCYCEHTENEVGRKAGNKVRVNGDRLYGVFHVILKGVDIIVWH